MRILYDSKKTIHKDPFGTLVPNENCTLNIHIPQSVGATGVECLIRLDDNDKALCIEVFTRNNDAAREYIEKYNEKMPLSHNIRKVIYRDRPLERTTSGKLIRKER